MPVSMRLATRFPRATSLVKTDPPNPKSESLASADGLILILDPEEQGDRTEKIPPESGVPGLDIRQNRRLHE